MNSKKFMILESVQKSVKMFTNLKNVHDFEKLFTISRK